MTRPLDFTALTEPVDQKELASYIDEVRLLPEYRDGSSAGRYGLAIFFTIVVGVPIVGMYVIVALTFNQNEARTTFTLGDAAVFALANLILVGLLTGIGFMYRTAFRGRGQWKKWLRLERFADANGLEFTTRNSDVPYAGDLFQGASKLELVDHLRLAGGPSTDYGTLRRTTTSSNRSTSQDYAYIALRLDHALPHLVLDAKRGTGRTTSVAGDQTLSLEGDFDKHFTLFAPSGYERDALYIFTPDLMALLIDEARAFDVEIVDEWMLFYSTKPFDLQNPAEHERVFRIAATVGAKALRQADGYSDERSADRALIAKPGRRLRGSLASVWVAAGLLVVVVPLVTMALANR